jgi:hypothetical protein
MELAKAVCNAGSEPDRTAIALVLVEKCEFFSADAL